MRIHFDYFDKSSFEENVIEKPGLPLELRVSQGDTNSRLTAQRLYKNSIMHAFRGVSNFATGKIIGVKIQKDWLGGVNKSNDSVTWNSVVDKTFVVIYDIFSREIVEHMYVADGIVSNGEALQPLWLDELTSPSKDTLRGNLVKIIAILNKCTRKYFFKWNNSKGTIELKHRNGKSVRNISLNDIDEDDLFILVKLLLLVSSKNTHLGVMFVNAYNFSDNVLKAFTEISKELFYDSYVFFYNCRQNSAIKTLKVELPNFLLNDN